KSDVILLYQHSIVEAEPAVTTPANRDRITLEHSQSGRRLAGIHDLHPGVVDTVHESSGQRRDCRHSLEQIQSRAFASQQDSRRTFDPGEVLAAGYAVCIVEP